jgi:hypothetical protein
MAPPTRRTALIRLLGAAAAPLGLHGLAQLGRASIFAQEAPPAIEPSEPLVEPVPTTEPAPPASFGGPGHHFYSLQGPGEDGPLRTGRTSDKWGQEIGFSTFEGGTFVMQLNYPPGLRQDWIGSRIGTFSIKDGAVMVDALGELNSIGCFAIEMRHQAYRQRKYIRANWLSIDPPTGMVAIGTDGTMATMENVARAVGVSAVRPQGEWNTVLFTAQGQHFEGWVNGEKAVEGDDYHFGAGQISLITMRMDKGSFRARFRNLHVWDGALPDPTSVWG